MPTITFIHPDGRKSEIEAKENWSIMQVAVANGIDEIEAVCGGSMTCATCHCYIHPDWWDRVIAEDNEKTEEEEDMLDMAFDVRNTSRLSCQVKLTDKLDGLIIALPGTRVDW